MLYHYPKLLAVAICLYWPVLFAFAQCPTSAELNITATLYTQENGLTSNMLAGIAKDSTGYRYFLGVDGKWIRYDGVNFGLKNYDRFSFEHYGLKTFETDQYTDYYTADIHYKNKKDKKGTQYRWAIIHDSLTCIVSNENKKEAFQFPKDIDAKQAIDFFPDGETCWITTVDKVFRFDIRVKKFFAVGLQNIPAINLSVQAPLFIFLRNDGVPYLLGGNTVLKLNSASGSFEKLCSLPPPQLTTSIHEIVMNNYLFVAASNILYEINLDNGAVKKSDLTEYTGIKNSSALKITALINYHDYLLAGTSNASLFIYNRCTGSMQHFQYEKQNSDEDLTNAVVWIKADEENVIWMQTEAGLIKLEVNSQRIKTYLPSAVKTGGLCNNCNNVRSIYAYDNTNLLIGSLGGVYSFNLNTGKFSDVVSPIDHQPVWNDQPVSSVTGDGDKNVFIGSWGNEGIFLLNSEKKKLINILQTKNNPGLSYSFLQCLFYDSYHVLWVGTREGFIRITNLDEFQKNDFKGQINVSDRLPKQGDSSSIHAGTCFAITEDKNENIWMGTTNGLYRYNYKTGSVIKYIHVPGDKKSLSDDEVRSIYISKNNEVWIGTNKGGLNHFNTTTKTFTAFTIENGLPNNSIYTILEDNKGYLWLGTNAGLCRFNIADHSVRNYTPRDGIQNYEFNTNAVAKTLDGRFCFGGRTGFNIFHPDSMNVIISPPQVVITSFKIFNQEFPVHDSVLHLSHDQNSVSFDFASLNFYRSNDNQYMYMMEGSDKEWIKSGNRQYTSYNNLPPGTYTFKVRAANYTGVWNTTATTMKFIIAPAWYNTWWFRSFMTFVFAASIYGLYRYRLRQMLKLQAVRNRIASDLHDEIGSTLSSISLSSTIIQNKLNGGDAEVTKLLQQVSNNTDNMMEALSDIVWAINTRNDRFDNVVNRMRYFALEILEPGNINIYFNVSEDILNVQLDMQQRKNLYLIFKEAVNNIAKYATCKNVYIEMNRSSSKIFVLHIKDDGKGFEAVAFANDEKNFSGNGIMNMKKRAEELGGVITITSIYGEGTSLQLSFPI